MEGTLVTVGGGVMGFLVLGFLIAQLVVSIRAEKDIKAQAIESRPVPAHAYSPGLSASTIDRCVVCGKGRDTPFHV